MVAFVGMVLDKLGSGNARRNQCFFVFLVPPHRDTVMGILGMAKRENKIDNCSVRLATCAMESTRFVDNGEKGWKFG